jgi:hypothetical protein
MSVNIAVSTQTINEASGFKDQLVYSYVINFQLDGDDDVNCVIPVAITTGPNETDAQYQGLLKLRTFLTQAVQAAENYRF